MSAEKDGKFYKDDKIKNMSYSDKLKELEDQWFGLVRDMRGIKQSGGDGKSIQYDLDMLEKAIDYLRPYADMENTDTLGVRIMPFPNVGYPGTYNPNNGNCS